MRSFDQYTFAARIQPVLLTVLPLVVFFFTWVPTGSVLVNTLIGLVGTCGGYALLAQVGRDQGSNKQPRLWKSWGGPPTTRLLRFRDAPNRFSLELLRTRIEILTGAPLPTEQDEQANPAEADERYEAAVGVLRTKTRNRTAFPLVFAENKNYGFRRNLWGLKPFGTGVAGLSALGSCLILLHSLGLPPSAAWVDTMILEPDSSTLVRVVGLLLNIVSLFVWLLVVKPRWVRTAADAYAHRLLESVEAISNTG